MYSYSALLYITHHTNLAMYQDRAMLESAGLLAANHSFLNMIKTIPCGMAENQLIMISDRIVETLTYNRIVVQVPSRNC